MALAKVASIQLLEAYPPVKDEATIPLPLDRTGVFKLMSAVLALRLPAVVPVRALLFHAATCSWLDKESIMHKVSNKHLLVDLIIICVVSVEEAKLNYYGTCYYLHIIQLSTLII